MAFIGQFLKNFFGEGSNDLRCLQVGLDASGKTTILYRLKLGEIVTTIPTIGFNVESFMVDGANLTVWDVGGCDKIRPLYRHYFANTQILVWVVDSNDRERLEETTYWLQQVMHEPELRDCVVLVFANKQDLPNAMRVPELQDKLGLTSVRHMPWFIQPCSASERDTSDLLAGFTWAVRTWKARGARTTTQPTPTPTITPTPSKSTPTPSASTKSGKAKITKDEKERAREAEQEALFLKWLVNDVDTAAEFIAKVEAGDISSFDHRTLLRIIWSNISLFGRREAIKRIFSQLSKYYEKFPLSLRNNETWIYFWIQMVHYAMEVTRNPSGDFIGFLFMNPLLMNQRFPYGHYRKKTILSPEAAKSVILPDKKPLPSIIPKAYIPTQHPPTAPKAQVPVPEGVTDDYDQDDKLTEEEFLTQFEACNLHKWDHKTHVRLAWAYIMKYGRKIGSDKVFKGIENFILNSKISRKTTFHVTMTFFWVQMVDIAIMSTPKGISFEEFLKQNPQLMEGGLFLQYYKKETMLNNPTARKEFVLPDIKPLPSIVEKK